MIGTISEEDSSIMASVFIVNILLGNIKDDLMVINNIARDTSDKYQLQSAEEYLSSLKNQISRVEEIKSSPLTGIKEKSVRTYELASELIQDVTVDWAYDYGKRMVELIRSGDALMEEKLEAIYTEASGLLNEMNKEQPEGIVKWMK